jgi:hypothetical protein
MSMTLSGSEHSTTRRTPYASCRSILHVRSAAMDIASHASQGAWRKPQIACLPEILTLKKLRDAGLDFQQTLVEF